MCMHVGGYVTIDTVFDQDQPSKDGCEDPLDTAISRKREKKEQSAKKHRGEGENKAIVHSR